MGGRIFFYLDYYKNLDFRGVFGVYMSNTTTVGNLKNLTLSIEVQNLVWTALWFELK